jgi:hypothetical protein
MAMRQIMRSYVFSHRHSPTELPVLSRHVFFIAPEEDGLKQGFFSEDSRMLRCVVS